MEFRSAKSILATGVILSTFTWLVAAQRGANPPATDQSQSAQGMIGGHGMMGLGMNQGSGTMGNNEMMQMWGMTPQMLNQGRMMMHATIARNDPATILGLKDQLKLSVGQQAQLQKIADQAQADTQSVLTPEQRNQLGELPTASGSMAQMYGQMMAHRQQMHGTAGSAAGDGTNANCPMMQMMKGMPMMGASQSSQPSK